MSPSSPRRAPFVIAGGWPPARASGVLLHPTSLPGGRLGREAYRFVDWLVAAGQSFWQVLPLGPPDKWGSPYASTSAFAGWPGLLARPEARVTRAEAQAYRAANAFWLDDWVAFCGGDGGAVADQVRFDREWGALRRYANERGVAIVGDLPIYVSRASADAAVHPEIFDRSRVAGVPPDFFSTTGQLWGNPTYRWSALAADGYRWWIERFRRMLHLFDAMRVDHFRGLVAYWAVPAGRRTARAGRWYRGPGRRLFDAVHGELGQLPLIAEDLGVITPQVHRLREQIGALGIHVLEFGFGSRRNADHPRNHRERSAVYTGTHDNLPVAAWWAQIDDRARSLVRAALADASIHERDPAWALVELAQSSRGCLAVVQAQDVLGLGGEARMNHPGTTAGNWTWRLERGALDTGVARRLREAAARHGRAGPGT